jgi:hypothetical protein
VRHSSDREWRCDWLEGGKFDVLNNLNANRLRDISFLDFYL